MFDKNLVLSILMQIDEALGKIVSRAKRIRSADNFTGTPAGMEKLDAICMLFMAIGKALKNIDIVTGGTLLSQYPKSIGREQWVSETSSPIITLILTPNRYSGYALMK